MLFCFLKNLHWQKNILKKLVCQNFQRQSTAANKSIYAGRSDITHFGFNIDIQLFSIVTERYWALVVNSPLYLYPASVIG